jgi:hypothetical protein
MTLMQGEGLVIVTACVINKLRWLSRRAVIKLLITGPVTEVYLLFID